jgi:monoamine oxidase
MTTHKLNIGIAGAGIAGLIAGLELQHAGHGVTIFEARSRTGGRIHSYKLDGMVVESGPEFIHGNGKETIRLLKRFNIPYEQASGKMYNTRGGQLRENYEMTAGWDQLLDEMKSISADLPFQEFLEKKFPGSRFIELRKAAIRFAEGFDLADTLTASTRALLAEWDHEDVEQYRIPDGYGILIRSLENEFESGNGKILLSHPVNHVCRNANEIRIRVNANQEFSMDKLIISLPLSSFNQMAPAAESIIFTPALEDKYAVVDQIGFGSVIKIVMIWESAFWKKLVPDARFIFSDFFVPAWWTQSPLDIPMLTGWLGGPKAILYGNEPDDFILDKAMESLCGIFSVSRQELKNKLRNYRIFNWINEPWSRGAYSYARIGFEKARAVWRQPVDGNIYFAGEAYYDGPFPGTVEAAIVNGMETARNLLTEIQ